MHGDFTEANGRHVPAPGMNLLEFLFWCDEIGVQVFRKGATPVFIGTPAALKEFERACRDGRLHALLPQLVTMTRPLPRSVTVKVAIVS